MEDAIVRVRAVVRGRVQQVGFRAFVLDHAEEAGLSGTVRNRSDGSLEVVVEGPRPRVDELVERLREGPGMARVDSVDVVEERPTGQRSGMRVTA